MRHPEGDFAVSEGFDAGTFPSLSGIDIRLSLGTAFVWFKEHFIKCNDRAELVKTWLPALYDGPKAWLDQLVYDRALMLVR